MAPASRMVMLALFVLVSGIACGGSKAGSSRYPARPDGCDVKLFNDTPTMPTDNLGPVGARCANDIPDAECLRTLEDEVCKLGGDVAWGVPESPSSEDGKKRWSARAAHTRAPRAPRDAGR